VLTRKVPFSDGDGFVDGASAGDVFSRIVQGDRPAFPPLPPRLAAAAAAVDGPAEGATKADDLASCELVRGSSV